MRKYLKKNYQALLSRLVCHLIYMIAIAALPYIIKKMVDCDYKNGIYDVLFLSFMFIMAIAIGMFAQYISQSSAFLTSREN